jgi:hypothetical protein
MTNSRDAERNEIEILIFEPISKNVIFKTIIPRKVDETTTKLTFLEMNHSCPEYFVLQSILN